jgi:hypothetical protein
MAEADASGGMREAAREWLVRTREAPRHWWLLGLTALNALLSASAVLFSHDVLGKIAGVVFLIWVGFSALWTRWWVQFDELEPSRRRLVRAAAIPGITAVVYIAVGLAVIAAGVVFVLWLLSALNDSGTFSRGHSRATTYDGPGWHGRLSRVGGADVIYGADGRLSSVGGEDVIYGADGRPSRLAGGDIIYGADGRLSSIGGEDVIYGADGRPSSIGGGDVIYGA